MTKRKSQHPGEAVGELHRVSSRALRHCQHSTACVHMCVAGTDGDGTPGSDRIKFLSCEPRARRFDHCADRRVLRLVLVPTRLVRDAAASANQQHSSCAGALRRANMENEDS
jgi:hypothetical protein